MNSLLDRLLGLKPAQWAGGGTRRLEWLQMPRHDLLLLLLLGAAAAAWGVMYLYRREKRNLSLPMRITFSALRLITIGGVVVMLLEPVVVFTKTDQIPSTILVLRDRSDSMTFQDAYANQTFADRLVSALGLGGIKELRSSTRQQLIDRVLAAGLPKQLQSNGDRNVVMQDFAGQLASNTVAPATQPATIDGSSTAIGLTIRQAITAYRGQPLAGILLITDGQSNAGESPIKVAEYAGGEGVPLVSIAAGTAEGPRNAKIDKIEVSPSVFVRDNNQAHVVIESKGLANAPATLILEKRKDGGAWEQVSRQPITLQENGQLQTVPFDFKEERPCALDLRATLADVGPELTTDDNVMSQSVKVIRQKIRVLFIAGSTFPEVEFLRNSLLRDMSVSASTWLQSATQDYQQPGNPPITHLPQTQDELNDYDCVVMYDPDPSAWPPNFPQMLTNFVGKEGGGLVYIAGERETKNLFDRSDDPSTQWLNMLPVVVDPGLYQSEVTMKLSAQEAWKLQMPEAGIDPIFQFDADPEKNQRILDNLPGMYWHFPVTRAKAAATVLARNADPRMRNEHGQHVLMATHLFSAGRTFFIAFDSTYRWRYLDEQYFDGFWARVVDRAGRGKQLGGRYPFTLSTDRTSYKPNSQVTLTARFNDPTDRDAGIDALHGEVEAPDSTPIAISLTPTKADPNVFETTFTVNKSGTHSVRVWTGAEEAKLVIKAATLDVKVELPNLELERPSADMSTLQAMAKASGGAVFDLSQGNEVAGAFKIHKVAQVLEERQEIWHAPLIWCTVLAALFAEWILRKKYQMV